MDIKNKAIFFPAISIATHTTIMKNNWLVNNKSPRFYLNNKTEDEQCFHHPYILTSAGHNYKNMNFMKEIGINNINEDVDIIFGDSGGFQIGTGELDDTDEIKSQLYDWMLQNSTVAPIIDVPPWGKNGNITINDLDESIKRTKYNIEFLINKNPREGFNWLNVLHGNNYNHREYWYNKIKDIEITKGWALGSLRKNFYVILLAFSVLLDNKELEKEDKCKLIHFFGLSSTRFMPILIYIKHKLNKYGYKTNISFDSSYATQNGGWGKYLIYPSSTGFMSYHLSNKTIGKFKDTPLPCKCSVCKGYTHLDILNEKALTNEGESLFYNVVQSHNVYMLKEYVDMLHNLIYTDCYDLWETCFKSEQIKVFKVIDKMFEAKTGNSHKVIERNVGLLGKCYKSTEAHEELEDIFA